MYNAWYLISDGQLMIGRKTKKGIDYVESDIPPYCYVEAKHKHVATGDVEFTDKNTLEGKRVVKVSFDKPHDIKKFREFMNKNNVDVYEADIPYVRRYMLDKDLVVNEDYRKAYYDIETEIEDKKIISIAIIGKNSREWLYGDEKQILVDFLEIMKDFDMMLGWYNIGFDRPIIDEALKKHRIKNTLRSLVEIDLLELYKSVPGVSSPSWELDYVGEKEVNMKKLKLKSDYNTKELKEYNLRDAEITKLIDEKMGLSDIRIGIANFCHIFPNEATRSMIPIDTMLLKKASELKIVLPCGKRESSERIKGAETFYPEVGRHESVAVLDFVGLYPNIIINKRLSPDIDKRLLPETVKFIMDQEKIYKQKYKETGDVSWKYRREALKILRNSCYGVFVSGFFRLHDKKLGSDITEGGREYIKLLRKHIESLPGYRVLYGDTDSNFVKVRDMSDAKKLMVWLNKRLHPYEVGLDKFFSAMLFTGGSGKSGEKVGIKKRYAGYDELDGGKLKIVGLEFKRSDSFGFMRRVQKRIIELILDDDGEKVVERYSIQIRERLLNGEYDDELVFSKGVKSNINDYKVEQPHVRAYRKLLAKGIKPFGKVQYVVTKGGEEPVIDGKLPGGIDRSWYWDVRIKPIIKRLMSVYEVKKQSKLELEV